VEWVVFAFVAVDRLWALETVAECCADFAGVLFSVVLLAAGFFFADAAEVAGFAVFFAADGVEDLFAPAPVACATRLLPGQSQQIETTATRTKVFLSSIASRSNDGSSSGWGRRRSPAP